MTYLNFRRTKIFGEQNFRHRLEFLSTEFLSDYYLRAICVLPGFTMFFQDEENTDDLNQQMIREISTVQNVSNANIARKKSQYFVSIKIRIMLSEIMDKNSADKYIRRTKFSADIIFGTEPNFRQLYPPNFCPIRYSGGVLAKVFFYYEKSFGRSQFFLKKVLAS